MNNLPCEQCTQTDNHCCIADIPYDLPIALSMLHFGSLVGINDIFITKHPKYDEKVVILKNGTSGNISKMPCVFFTDGKCAIYENRPDICRIYGTELMRCRYECSGIKHKEFIERISMQDIEKLDAYALNKSLTNKYIDKVVL